ncbi:MAG: 1-acyl-sn-glycerol-3-phosphate acyltransferase [Hahellaceae bacterium]|nr:1-acyl-sn-glycerol-3-phosphate acyltransferase [Hahellaceae bacterium]
MSDAFEAIRPYRDAEVPEVVARLCADPMLIHAIGRYKFPRLSRAFPALSGRLIKSVFNYHFHKVVTVDQVQKRMVHFVENIVDRSTSALRVTGLDQVPRDRACLFISNHRDIALDPALINYALYHDGRQTVEIAIGDNLLENPVVADIMRLNRSFVVQRSVEGVKARLMALTRLSQYIATTLQSGRSVWIAQREGRAKDGLDRTDPAVIKMLTLFARKASLDFAQAIKQLSIVPVSLSYEYDPCDRLKARELVLRRSGDYRKGPGEDLQSILDGIAGHKGRVCLHFNPPMTAACEDADDVARAIDRAIIGSYQLFPSNLVALAQLNQLPEDWSTLAEAALHQLQEGTQMLRTSMLRENPALFETESQRFRTRLEACPADWRSQLQAMYANPLISQVLLKS